MNLISFSVRRWVAIICLMLAITGLGINAYRKLPLEELPKTDMPYITVVTVYPGASPGEIETDVAKRIEDATGAIDGLKSLTSSCMENACQTLLEFNIGTDVDLAANDVREKLDLIARDFPEGVEKPKVLKFDINAQAIINLAVTGNRPVDELFDYADNEFRDRLAAVSGVADVKLTGGSKREVQVLLDRERLAARGLSSLDVVAALRRDVKMIPAGRINHQGFEYTVKFDADFQEFADLASLEVANRNGQRCYLKDVGNVVMAGEELRQSASIDGRRCIAVQIIKKADANAVEVVRNIKASIKDLNNTLPGGIEVVWVSDAGAYIQSSADNAVGNIWQSIVLTAVLMFFFLYNFSSTFTIAITMPLTIVAGVFFIYLMGYTLNTVTLLALGLSTGILVTNSIVVLESIVAKVAAGRRVDEAAIEGSSEIVAAVIASAGTNIVVLFPICGMKGMIGQFFIPFALTMVGITAISLLLSFTLTPAVAAIIIRQESTDRGWLSKFERGWNHYFARFTDLIVRIVEYLAARRLLSGFTLLVTFVLLFHALYLVPAIGFSFLPISDRGEIFVKLEFPATFSLSNTVERTAQLEKLLADLPELQHRLTTVGKIDGTVGQTSEGVYLAQIFCKFSEKTERTADIHALRNMIKERLSGLQDVISTTSLPDQSGTGAELKLVIRGSEFSELNGIISSLVSKAGQTDWLKEIDTSVRSGKNELRVIPRRAVLGDLKVPATQLGMVLRTSLEGTLSGSYKKDARTYNIRVKLSGREGINQISQLEMPGPTGHPIILKNFASIEQHQSPVLITRRNKGRVAIFYANPAAGVPLARAAEQLISLVTAEKPLPAGYSLHYIGKVEIMKEGIADFVEVGIIAFVLTYLLLAAILNSFSQPLIILLTIPLGLIGCIWALYLTGESISMMVLLGGVMLIGIVVNNAILIMDRVQVNIDAGLSSHQAMFGALRHEMRAITMITLAAVAGMLPMAIDSSLGSELRSGIGMAAIGGIAISAVFTLIVLPIFYCLTNRQSAR
ncbi:MAG TPA: efflux RND transporter permease subunit [Candidatus Rifleibacterium sp.]|nr:efflux RND transporter permease subunit [Candidatus Rifleibacterium sp.]HPT45267.1 efflux RND transporter permease subunit [Candidatus Rifleibacterium sp.]